MNIKKSGGSLAVAVSLFALSGVATAGEYFACTQEGDFPTYGNRANTIDALTSMADALRCQDGAFDQEAVGWNPDDPIWQWKGKDFKGCEVHTKLARQLYEKREDDGSPPRRNKHGTNDSKGAVNDLQTGGAKDESATLRLYSFMETIGNATENPGKDGDADEFVDSAMDAIYCITTL